MDEHDYKQREMFEIPELIKSFESGDYTRNVTRLSRGRNLELTMTSYLCGSGVNQTDVCLRLGSAEKPEEVHKYILKEGEVYHDAKIQHYKPLTKNPLEILSVCLRKLDYEAYDALKERATLQLRQALESSEKELRENF